MEQAGSTTRRLVAPTWPAGRLRAVHRRCSRTATCLRRPAPLPASPSPSDAGVTEAEAAGLWPHTQPVRLQTYGDASEQVTVFRGQRINRAAVTAGEPQLLAVRRDTAHVRRAATVDVPRDDLVMRREIDDSDAAGAAVGDIEPLAVTARIEPVRVTAGLDEAEA